MKTHLRAAFLSFLAVPAFASMLIVSPALGQQQQTKEPPSKSSSLMPSETAEQPGIVVLSGVATSAHIADPNERVVFNGRVMRMADFVAAVSSSTEAVPRPRNPEKRNREKDPPTPPSKPLN